MKIYDRIPSKLAKIINNENGNFIPLNSARNKENVKEEFISSLIKENLLLQHKVNELSIYKLESLNVNNLSKLKSMSKPKYKSKNSKNIH